MSSLPPPFRLVAKLRNNRLIRARERLGLGCRQAAEAIGISYSSLINLESLHDSPIGASGWRDTACKISEWYGYIPEDLWPDCVLAVEQVRATLELSPGDQLAFDDMRTRALPPPPDQLLVGKELVEQTEQALSMLTPCERDVLVKRFGLCGNTPMTLENAAKIYGISREQVRQREQKALRHLRHPGLQKILQAFIET